MVQREAQDLMGQRQEHHSRQIMNLAALAAVAPAGSPGLSLLPRLPLLQRSFEIKGGDQTPDVLRRLQLRHSGRMDDKSSFFIL